MGSLGAKEVAVVDSYFTLVRGISTAQPDTENWGGGKVTVPIPSIHARYSTAV